MSISLYMEFVARDTVEYTVFEEDEKNKLNC